MRRDVSACASQRSYILAYLVAQLYGRTTPSRQKHAVSSFHARRYDIPALVRSAGASSDDGGFWQRSLGRARRKEDARCSFLKSSVFSLRYPRVMQATDRLGLETLYENTVEERCNRLD